MRQCLIKTTIERILLDQRIVLAKKIRHRALIKPLPMQSPFATGIYQLVAHQCLQNMPPTCAFAGIG